MVRASVGRFRLPESPRASRPAETCGRMTAPVFVFLGLQNENNTGSAKAAACPTFPDGSATESRWAIERRHVSSEIP